MHHFIAIVVYCGDLEQNEPEFSCIPVGKKWNVAAMGLGGGRWRVTTERTQRFSFARWKSSESQFHDSVNILNITELYSLEWLR